MTIVLFIAGLVFLIVGAELLVRGASQLASAFGIPSLIVGLTVVAFGTSAPEFAVSLKAVFSNEADIVLGNVIGSNIMNVLFILGLSALVCPLFVSKQLIRFDVPLVIVASVLVYLFASDGTISRPEGFLLFGCLIIYTSFLIYKGRQSNGISDPDSAATDETEKTKPTPMWLNLVLLAVGLGLLVLGSRWLVHSAVAVAQHLGVSELIISLTVVAAGTSLPEVVTSLVASFRGERDIAVGNVVGSNLFNLLGVLGLAASVAPSELAVPPTALSLDIPIMVVVAFAALPIFFTDGMISRWEGGLFFGYYVAYTVYLVLLATEHTALPPFRAGMIYFIIPLTLITLGVVVTQSFRKSKALE